MYEREQKRLPSDETVRILRAGRWEMHNCLNLSMHGCMIDGTDGDFADHTLVSIELRPDTRVEGQVVWRREGRIGLRFASSLDRATVTALAWPDAENLYGVAEEYKIEGPVRARIPAG